MDWSVSINLSVAHNRTCTSPPKVVTRSCYIEGCRKGVKGTVFLKYVGNTMRSMCQVRYKVPVTHFELDTQQRGGL